MIDLLGFDINMAYVCLDKVLCSDQCNTISNSKYSHCTGERECNTVFNVSIPCELQRECNTVFNVSIPRELQSECNTVFNVNYRENATQYSMYFM